MMYQVHYAYACCTGKIRMNNEDNFWCNGEMLPEENQGLEGVHGKVVQSRELPVLAVFDGMGGESCGEIAASLAAAELGKSCERQRRMLAKDPDTFLHDVCMDMNRAVCDYGKENRIHAMGSTLAMIVCNRKKLYACNLGDSRIFRYGENGLSQISTDHILGNGLFGKAPITQYLGIHEEQMLLEPFVTEMEYIPGDKFLLCSDGLTDMLSVQEIEEILKKNISLEKMTEELMSTAMMKGGRDNTTIILCEIQPGEEKSSFLRWFRSLMGERKGEVS